MPYTPRPGTAPIPNKAGKTNWVEQTGGLPSYIRRIAEHLKGQGKSTSVAIATAVNTVKRWAAGGTVTAHGGPRVSAKTQAQAAAALADWNRKKAQAHSLSAFGAAVYLELSNPKALSAVDLAVLLDLAWDPKKHPRGPDGRFIRVLGAAARASRPGGGAVRTKDKTPDLSGMSYRDLLSLGRKRPELKGQIRAEALRRNPDLAKKRAAPKPPPEPADPTAGMNEVERHKYLGGLIVKLYDTDLSKAERERIADEYTRLSVGQSAFVHMDVEELTKRLTASDQTPVDRLLAEAELRRRGLHTPEQRRAAIDAAYHAELGHYQAARDSAFPAPGSKHRFDIPSRPLYQAEKVITNRKQRERIVRLHNELAKRYGFGFDVMEPVSSRYPAERLRRENREPPYAYIRWDYGAKMLILGSRAAFDEEKMRGDAVDRGSGPWHPPGTMELQGVLTHEYGHVLLDHPGGTPRKRRTATAKLAAQKAVEAKHGFTPSGAAKYGRTGWISRYAETNRSEYEAELFAWYHWGGDSRPEWVITWGEALHHHLGLDATPMGDEW